MNAVLAELVGAAHEQRQQVAVVIIGILVPPATAQDAPDRPARAPRKPRDVARMNNDVVSARGGLPLWHHSWLNRLAWGQGAPSGIQCRGIIKHLGWCIGPVHSPG